MKISKVTDYAALTHHHPNQPHVFHIIYHILFDCMYLCIDLPYFVPLHKTHGIAYGRVSQMSKIGFLINQNVGYLSPLCPKVGYLQYMGWVPTLKQVTAALPSHTLVLHKNRLCMWSDSPRDRILKVCIRCIGVMLCPCHFLFWNDTPAGWGTSSAGWGISSSHHSLLGLSHDNPDRVFHWACHMIIQIHFFTGLVSRPKDSPCLWWLQSHWPSDSAGDRKICLWCKGLLLTPAIFIVCTR